MMRLLIDIRSRIYDMQHEVATREMLTRWSARRDRWCGYSLGDETAREMRLLFDGKDVLGCRCPCRWQPGGRETEEGLFRDLKPDGTPEIFS
jgi:hypothetical protein